MGKMRSTPWPKLTLRTVIVSPNPVLLRAMTVPSKAWSRSLSPSLIFTWTLMVSPGRKVGTASGRLFLLMNFVNNAFCMEISLIFYHIRSRGPALLAVGARHKACSAQNRECQRAASRNRPLANARGSVPGGVVTAHPAAGPAAGARFFPWRPGRGSGGSLRDFRSTILPAPSSRGNRRDGGRGGNPAQPRCGRNPERNRKRRKSRYRGHREAGGRRCQ